MATARPPLPIPNAAVVALSPDGKWLASVKGGKISVSNVSSAGRTLPILSTTLVDHIAFAANDETLVSVASNGYVRLWDLRPGALMRRVCDIANRELTAGEREKFGLPESSAPLCESRTH